MLRREDRSGGAIRCGVAFAALPCLGAVALVLAAMPAMAAEDTGSATQAAAGNVGATGSIEKAPDSRRSLEDTPRARPERTGTAAAAVLKPIAPPPARVPTISAGPVWDQELRRNAAIQAKLRTEVGDRVFFSAGSAELGSRARAALSIQAAWLNRWHEFEAAIEGHADDPGTEAENMALAARRAEAVRRRLIDEGVEAGRLAIVAQGRARRVATCRDPSCAAQNRRALTLVFVIGTRERLERASGPVADALEQVPALGRQLPAAAGRAGVAR